jgi:hypothetical protein
MLEVTLVERNCDTNVRKSTLWWNSVTSARFVVRYSYVFIFGGIHDNMQFNVKCG